MKQGLPGLLASAILLFAASPLVAQSGQGPQGSQPSVQVPPSVRPTPGQLELSKMIWSTLAAVDHANRSGNYSVLRDISASGFQINNNAAQLAQVFSGLRELNIDLGNTLLVPPTYSVAPQFIREDIFRVQGVFQIRPVSIGFDLYYQWEQGRWKLFGIDLQPLEMVQAQ
ncbi:MAG: hypothetical protein V2I27_11805 [Erythrobacter sp.]|jgi:hypothetical protein|nr:hypothetical protein [Erythrobacter sp.]